MSQSELPPFITVIIPTYNRGHMLRSTLASLFDQSYDCDRYELVVVDNNSSDKTKEIIAAAQQAATVRLKYVFEPRQGVHYARNTGYKYSQGDILYFTDDDMIADRELLREIVKPFSYDRNVASVTGRVLPKWEETPPNWVLEFCSNALLSLNDRPEYLIIAPYDCGVYSCHQALRKEAFVRTGGYNPENTAGKWIGDGETGLNIKLKDLGYLFAYIRSSVTYHMIPSSRMTQEYLNKRFVNQGYSDSYTDYRRYGHSRFQLVGNIARHARGMMNQVARGSAKYLLGKRSWRINRGRSGYYRARLSYDTRLLFSADWRAMVLKNDWLNE